MSWISKVFLRNWKKLTSNLLKEVSMRIQTIRYLLFALCAVIIVVFVAFAAMQSEYLNWDYNDPELAVAGDHPAWR